MKKIHLFLIIGLLITPIAFIGGVAAFKYFSESGEGSASKYQTVYWNKLRELNLDTGKPTEELELLDGAKVEIPGFVVPLDDDDTGYSEFLFVPNQQACIHVPPPPANQMIYVIMNSKPTPKRELGPIWLKGTLKIQDKKSEFGTVSYKLSADGFRKFNY